jgi:adhesin HecA-like repeat protein
MMFRRGDSDDKHDQHDQPIQPSEVRMADGQGNEVTVVGQGARLEGTVVSAGSLRIDGQVKGKITAEGDVALSSASQVEADIHAQNVTVSGRFRGNIVAQGRAELTRGGRVDGNVTAKTLVIAEGAVFNGQSNMDPAKAPRDRAASSADGDGSAAPAEVSAPAK